MRVSSSTRLAKATVVRESVNRNELLCTMSFLQYYSYTMLSYYYNVIVATLLYP
jgi:hypothetical protein